MSKNRSVATEKPEGRFANGACELQHVRISFFLRYYNADNLRFTTAPLMNCIYGIR